MLNYYQEYLLKLDKNKRHRSLRHLHSGSNSTLIDFSNNDYLNLTRHPVCIEAAKSAADIYGVGATGSRLLSGNYDLCTAFEKQIAQDKATEASLIFNTGFQANLTVLSALLDENVLKQQALVFFDKLNHASLYQAVFLSKSHMLRYRHNSMQHLTALLNKYENDPRPKFIVTETVFGMDGDRAPLTEIISLAQKFDAFLYLDEAHATGVFGKNGYGLSTDCVFGDISYLIMGTFSKALGGSGAYIATNQVLCDYLINKAAGFIYSTAPSPTSLASAFKAWQLVRDMGEKRQKLLNLAEFTRNLLIQNAFNIGDSHTHIIPIILGEEEVCLNIQQALLEGGYLLSSIRPPTVPPKTARLRLALNSIHNEEIIIKFVDNLKRVIS